MKFRLIPEALTLLQKEKQRRIEKLNQKVFKLAVTDSQSLYDKLRKSNS